MNNSKNRQSILWLTQLSVLTAIIFLLAFTPLGYLKAGPISITFLTIPVVVGAIVLGPYAGLILGGIFGLTSFIQCFGMDPFGVALLQINPVFTFIMCMVPRMLMGYLVGVIFLGLIKKDKTKLLSYGAASLSGALLNTIFFMTALILLFGSTDIIMNLRGGKNVILFVATIVGINGIVEAVATTIIGVAISKALNRFVK